jgi:hypothetical protein
MYVSLRLKKRKLNFLIDENKSFIKVKKKLLNDKK